MLKASLLLLMMGLASFAGSQPAAMSSMSGHMYVTALRPVQPGDQQKAAAVALAAKTAMAPYEDYHKALAEGYRIWSTEDDDQGHDNMDHAAMPGMKMN